MKHADRGINAQECPDRKHIHCRGVQNFTVWFPRRNTWNMTWLLTWWPRILDLVPLSGTNVSIFHYAVPILKKMYRTCDKTCLPSNPGFHAGSLSVCWAVWDIQLSSIFHWKTQSPACGRGQSDLAKHVLPERDKPLVCVLFAREISRLFQFSNLMPQVFKTAVCCLQIIIAETHHDRCQSRSWLFPTTVGWCLFGSISCPNFHHVIRKTRWNQRTIQF